jgi:predicted O-methyltransferase YrrM
MPAKLDFAPITFHSYDLSLAFHFETPQELFALRVLAWSLPPNPVIVNIGAGAGTSSLAFAESRRDAKIYTVDISEGGPYGGMQNEVNAFAGKDGLTLPVQILGDSKEIGGKWKGKKYHGPDIDLCFVDGDHSYEGCFGDIIAWRDHVKPGGLMVFHDYDRDVWADVAKAVSDSGALADFEFVLHVDTVYAVRKCGG